MTGRAVILASRQYPQRGAYNKTTPTDRIHLSLDERGIKGEGAPVPDTGPEGKQDKPTPQPVILASRQYPQGGGVTQVSKTTQTTFPISLDGRGIKGEGVPVLDTGSRG